MLVFGGVCIQKILRQQRCANTWKDLLISYASHQTTLIIILLKLMMWCRPNDRPLQISVRWGVLSYPVILRILGFFSSWFSTKIHRPWLLIYFGSTSSCMTRLTNIYKNNNYVEIQQFFHQIPEVSCKKVVLFWGCFFHAPGMNCSTGWQLEPRAPLNWIRDVARDVRH